MIKKLLGGYIILFLLIIFLSIVAIGEDDLLFISLAEAIFGGVYWLLALALWLLIT